jgi:RimJ/RimL family protein N-acetyltransferase
VDGVADLPSARVAERAGFLLEGTLRNNELGTDGTPRDTIIFVRSKNQELLTRATNS